MPRTRNFKELAGPIDADPRRRARVEAYKHAALDAMKLADLREERELRQTDIAGKLGVSQANISRVEGQDDVYVSTLRRYVEALGGTLEIRAVFPDQTIAVVAHSTGSARSRRASSKIARAGSKKSR